MSDHLQRIEERLDSLIEKLELHGNRLTAIEADLRYHIKRTDALEDMVKRHEKYFWMAMGVLSIASPAIQLLLKYLGK